MYVIWVLCDELYVVFENACMQVTHRENPESPWDSGSWKSENDLLLNGATFTESGGPVSTSGFGNKIMKAMPGILTGEMTVFAGPLKCVPKLPC